MPVTKVTGKLNHKSASTMRIQIGKTWYPCSLDMFTNISIGPWELGDIVEIDLNSVGQVKGIRTVQTYRMPLDQ